jgi:hypothetical protein
MSDALTRQPWSERREPIPTPNLRIMLHHYSRPEHLFRTVTMYADDERERICDAIAATRTWYWGRHARENRRYYLQERLFVEARMVEAFSAKYGPPKGRHPVFFYLYPSLSLPIIEERLRQRRQYDESETNYLLVDLQELADTTQISFTLCDSHRSYRAAMVRQGLLSGDASLAPPADHGTVFHIRELAEVYARHQGEDDLYFEVQVWDPTILDPWKETRGLP